MRILIHDYAGHPFPVQLSRSLAKQGHIVLHVYSKSIQTPRGSLLKKKEDPECFNILGISLSKPFQKHNFFVRRFQEIEYGKLLAKEAMQFAPDVVISGNTPLDTQKIVQKACIKKNIPFIFWVQDVYGIAVDKILSKKYSFFGKLIGWYYIKLERNLLKKSQEVIVISEDFRSFVDPYLTNKKAYVIENWSPIEELPLQSKENEWAKKYKLNKKRCIIYTGTLGMKHNPELILQLAKQFKEDDSVRIIVISEGLGADWLTVKKNEFNLDNLLILGFQPFDCIPDVLATADLLIGILEPDAGVFSVPSKVLTYLCAGRPILLAVPSENLSAQIIIKNDAGIIVSPNDISGFVIEARKLLNDDILSTRLGKNAREYAEKTFNIKTITSRFNTIIQKKVLK